MAITQENTTTREEQNNPQTPFQLPERDTASATTFARHR